MYWMAIWHSTGNYFVTTVCCFPCTGKVPCILAIFYCYTIKPDNCTNCSSVSGLELVSHCFVFPISFLCSNLQHIINIFLFIPELSHNWDIIIWHLSWLTLVSQLTHRVALPLTSKSVEGKKSTKQDVWKLKTQMLD
jgi:hypothetical protein